MKDQTLITPKLIRNDLISQLENRQAVHKQAEEKYGDTVCRSISFAYNFVHAVRQDNSELNRFLEHDFWADKKLTKDAKHLPRQVMRFILGAESTSGALYEKARNYAQVVEYYLSLRLSPANMEADLSKTTLEEIYKKIKQNKQSATSSTLQAPPRTYQHTVLVERNEGRTNAPADMSDLNDLTSENDSFENDSNDFDDGGSSIELSDDIENHSPYQFDEVRELAINMDDNRLMKVLALLPGDLALIKIRREGDNEGWAKFQAIGIKIPHSDG